MQHLKAYLAVEVKEIEEHKYYLSKKLRHDVGIDYAAEDWITNGHAARFHKVYLKHMSNISKVCKTLCGSVNDCHGINNCPLSLDIIHKVLED